MPVTLSAADIKLALDSLASELGAIGERGELVVVGGAALVLLFGARETTKDVDAYFLAPAGPVMRAAAARVADRLNLPEDWLNDGARGFFVGLTAGSVLHESSFLLVTHSKIFGSCA